MYEENENEIEIKCFFFIILWVVDDEQVLNTHNLFSSMSKKNKLFMWNVSM